MVVTVILPGHLIVSFFKRVVGFPCFWIVNSLIDIANWTPNVCKCCIYSLHSDYNAHSHMHPFSSLVPRLLPELGVRLYPLYLIHSLM